MSTPLRYLAIVMLAATVGWFAARHLGPRHAAAPTPAPAEGAARKPLYYQSAMHPWIKSDRPGRCTICGMELTPVFEGDKGFDAREGVVSLGTNIIQVIQVDSQPVRRLPLERTLRVAGTIDDNDTRHRIVSATIDGRVDDLAVNYVGAEVVAGQPLATFYSPPLLAAEREYVALRKRTPPAPLQAEHERLLAAAAQRLLQLGLADAQIQALPSKSETNTHSELLAPMTGTVVQRFVYAGQYVKEGDKLFEIADFSTMWFLFDAYEQDLAWLRPGQRVDVTTPAAPGQVFTGMVAFLDPNLREMTRSAKVRVELPNPVLANSAPPRRALFHKLYAEASVHLDLPEVLAVPRSAVLAPGPQAVVYLDQGGGAYQQRRLKLGRRGDTHWEVLEGLSEGDRVVTAGNLLIDAQAQLNASSAEPAGTPPEAPPAPFPALTRGQTDAARAIVEYADAITAALAADNLARFQELLPRARPLTAQLAAAFPAGSSWHPLADALAAAVPGDAGTDLPSARQRFHPFSAATVTLAKALRRQDPAFAALKVFRCPMTKDAFPGAPRTAEWLQLQSEVRNPYFGAEMLDCGSEVKP